MTQNLLSQEALSALAQEIAHQSYPTGALYVLATPIGNIGDISLRALHVLQLADAIACEDTRNTSQLLSRYGLSKPLIAAHEHNEREVGAAIVKRLQAGERIAVVSDAGTPGLSDPGAKIADLALQAGLRVIPLPGAAAAVSALSVAGMAHNQFLFVGFLPSKAKQRESALLALRAQSATLIFYEAPHRIRETVEALTQCFEGSRQILFAREITKLFEDIHRCPLDQALAWVDADPHRLKGEYVLVLEGAPQQTDGEEVEAVRVLTILLEACSVKEASQLAAQITGLKKNRLYEIALELSGKNI